MFRKSLAVLGLLCLPGTALAGDEILYAPAPDWVTPAPPIDRSKLGGSVPIMIFDQQQRLADGQVWAYSDIATRLSTPQVVAQAGTLQLPWDPAKGDIIIHRLEILRGDETIDLIASGSRFNVIQREQKLEQAWLDGVLTATLAVEGLRVGDVLRVSFSQTRKDPAWAGEIFTSAPILTAPVKMDFGRERLLWSNDLPLEVRSYSGVALPAPVDLPKGYRELTLTIPQPKLAEMPDDAPQRFKPQPLVEASTYRNWTEVSSGLAPLYTTKGAIQAGSPLAAEVAKIKAATPDPRVRAAMALQLVQDKIRYLYRGMDNGNYVPQQPGDTWSLRYGDCKAKSLLLLAILRELGIEAVPALVSTNGGDMLGEVRLPSPGAFNHIIVRATIGSETLWLDGTEGGTRIEDLADVPRFVAALPLSAKGSALETLPRRPKARPDLEMQVTYDARPGVSFPALYEVELHTRGGLAEAIRAGQGVADRDALNKAFDPLLEQLVGAHSAYGWKMDYDAETGVAKVSASGVAYPEWEWLDDHYELTIDKTLSNLNFAPDRARSAWKAIPVAANGVVDGGLVWKMRLPDGGRDFALIGSKTLPEMLAGSWMKRTVTLEGEWVSMHDRVSDGMTEIAAADIPAARAAVAAARAQPLRLLAGTDTPSRPRQIFEGKRDGAFAPLIAAYTKAVEEDPDEVFNYNARAWFFESIYDRPKALADLDKAIEMAPDADYHVRRAKVYRALGDKEKAAADYQAAVDIDPSSAGAVGGLASIQMEMGQRDDAVDLLESRISQGGRDQIDWQRALASLLADHGEMTDAMLMFDEMLTRSPNNVSALNSRCWVSGTHDINLEQALADCTKAIQLSENSAAVLDSRAMVYFRLGKLAEALADLNAALDAESEQSASLFMRGVILKRQGKKGWEDDLAFARMIDPNVDERFGRWGIKP